MQAGLNGGGETLVAKMAAARARKAAAKVRVDEHAFDTQAIADRYSKLKADTRISKLRVRPSITLYVSAPDGRRIRLGAKYRPIFHYEMGGVMHAEDIRKISAAKAHLREHFQCQQGVEVKFLD